MSPRPKVAPLPPRFTYPDRVIGYWKAAMRSRIEATRALADFAVCRGDCHCHSTFSDGVATVAETAAWKEQAGLDFLFVTDHDTVRQKAQCARYPSMWWGQEPGAQHHHLGILGLERRFRTGPDLAKDYRRVIELGGFPFIPHPTGWFPDVRYAAEQIEALDVLGDDFSMELINGANNIFDCYDVTDEMSVALWDRHLCRGKVVRGMGNSDAHLPQTLGDVWNGVLLDKPTRQGVLQALWAGHFFASDAPFVHVRSGQAVMGDTLVRRAGSRVQVRYTCVDSLGLQRVRVISGGRVVQELWPRDQQVVRGAYALEYGGGRSYVRVECTARDGRRAFANPVYVKQR